MAIAQSSLYVPALILTTLRLLLNSIWWIICLVVSCSSIRQATGSLERNFLHMVRPHLVDLHESDSDSSAENATTKAGYVITASVIICLGLVDGQVSIPEVQ